MISSKTLKPNTRLLFPNHLTVAVIAIILFGVSSCKEKSDPVIKNLQGKWVLLSKTVPKREYYKNETGVWKEKYILKPKDEYILTDTCKFLSFVNSTDYLAYSRCGDVHTDFKGKFFVLNNPGRGVLTLTLVPDIHINETDTIRTGFEIMDIVRLQGDSLIVVKETTWLNRDSLPQPRFNFKFIYKKMK